jgi:hypothetical protein
MLEAIEKWYQNIQKTKEFEPGTDDKAYYELKDLINKYAPGEGCFRLPDGTISDKGFFESEFPGFDDEERPANAKKTKRKKG